MVQGNRRILRRGLHVPLLASLMFMVAASGAGAADATAEVSAAPILNGPNAGCTRITIKVTPHDSAVRDVHLWLGTKTHSAPRPPATNPPENVTTTGDPGNFKPTPGAGLPNNWTGGVGGTALPAGGLGTSTFTQNWTGPADLPGPTEFSIDYCGTKPLLKNKEFKAVKITGPEGRTIAEFPGFVPGTGG